MYFIWYLGLKEEMSQYIKSRHIIKRGVHNIFFSMSLTDITLDVCSKTKLCHGKEINVHKTYFSTCVTSLMNAPWDVLCMRRLVFILAADKTVDDDDDYGEDPVLVARGVKYFMNNIFSFFVCMLAGLLGLMFLPGAVRVLALTNKSDNPLRVCQ